MWPPRTLAITDRRRLTARGALDEGIAVVAFVVALAEAGVDAVQVRERDWPDGRLLEVARSARRAVAGSRCRVFVNERAHVAVAAGAHGVHVRGDGMPVARVRRAWPEGLLIGRSMHVGDAPADAQGADVVMFGTVFPSASKGPDAPVVGVTALADWTGQPGMPPVVAVGGIEAQRCESVRRAGASGVAGIELFVRAWEQGTTSLASLVAEIHAVFRDGERAQ
jgi:thiamine-phosphate pyrophosphorylase